MSGVESVSSCDPWPVLSAVPREDYVLRLYVTGLSPRSTEAIARIREVCDEYLAGHYELEVIDLYKQPELAQRAQLIASPTLIKERPLPLRRLVGSMADEARVLGGLDLRKRVSS
ncbi:MAG: circadian clock KaiB family protein [Planctomycetaceae bacterium]|nr:circadian clock KaiB family protein [Planctomycetaceae bacterium]